jgi:glutamate synthase domain-containing protein 2
MSYGSISKEAHETLAIAMNRIGGKSNTGRRRRRPRTLYLDQREGRLQKQRHQAGGLGPLRRDSLYLSKAKEIQIKMAQGAKPGEGGQLPGQRSIPGLPKCATPPPVWG